MINYNIEKEYRKYFINNLFEKNDNKPREICN